MRVASLFIVGLLLLLHVGGPRALDERRQLVGGQAHVPHDADDVQIFQLQALLLQLPLAGLQLGDLSRVLLILVVDLLDFRVHFASLLSWQTAIAIEVILPITAVQIGVRNGISTVNHHIIAHINSAMRRRVGVRRIVGVDEKHQIAGAGVGG